MWFNYFYQIQKKYRIRLSTKTPLIVRLDAKNVTKNKVIDLIDTSKDSFLYYLEKTVKYFTKKYHCYAIIGADEVSFVFIDPMPFIKNLNAVKHHNSERIVSLFSQYFFDFFNSFNNNRKIFWDVKCFSIPYDKATSYISYRSKSIKEIMVTYFLKTKGAKVRDVKMDEKIAQCSKFPDYKLLDKIKDGFLYFNGDKIDLNEFLNSGNIKIIENKTINNSLFDDLL